MWAPKGIADDPDTFVAFRGNFTAPAGQNYLHIVGASEYLVWLDGKLIHDGPDRFARQFPEYQSVDLGDAAGEHTLAIQVRNDGVTSRILSSMPAFLAAEVTQGDRPIPIRWKCARVPGYRPQAQRISDILGWIDWCDTRQSWINWQRPLFVEDGWVDPVDVDPGIGKITPCRTAPVRLNRLSIKPMAGGPMATTYGYEQDEPATRFFLDDLAPKGIPPQGVWRRYDLGRVRLGRAAITLDCSAGSIIEIATSEQLQHDRVHPWITLSGSRTCNMDHFIARGGTQEFMPFTPKGGRYLEIHVKSATPVKFLREEFLERTSFGEPTGSFECDDPLLNKIWRVGVNTVQACADDALVDCPTRERGEWTGDVASVATDIAAVAFGDLSLSRRALVQAAQVARNDGMVAGVGPGDPGYLSTYAAQWTTACVHYYHLTGDKTLLEELFPAAQRNMDAFEKHLHPEGLDGGLGWGFVDWGYVGNAGPSDMALNLHYLNALKAFDQWKNLLGKGQDAERTESTYARVRTIVRKWMDGQTAKPGGWKNVGYHRASLALYAGLVSKPEKAACIQMIKDHLMSCFPNNPNGPRLSDPGVADLHIMTPYFGHWAMAALLENGEADFVLDQYRKCWGWALQGGDNTWLEVFDPRWSHCHEWSGCPTWQLSHYVLGIRTRYDLGNGIFEFNPVVSKLGRASGSLPFGNGGLIKVDWRKSGGRIRVTFQTNRPVKIRYRGIEAEVKDRYETSIPVRV